VVSANSTYFFNLAAHFRMQYADGGFGRKAGNLASLTTKLQSCQDKNKKAAPVSGAAFCGVLDA
jgi:hypothetical protein